MPILPSRQFEESLLASGSHVAIIGMDEVGRGAIAGPVAVGASVFTANLDEHPAWLRDSKLLSEKRRESLIPDLQAWSPAHAVGLASADEVETHGITTALRMAGARALAAVITDLLAAGTVTSPASECLVLLDGSHNWLAGRVPGSDELTDVLRVPTVTLVKADRDCVSVAAASVFAKVARDHLMIELAGRFPHYGWEGNKGYGAAAHYDGIRDHGLVPGVHRASWIR